MEDLRRSWLLGTYKRLVVQPTASDLASSNNSRAAGQLFTRCERIRDPLRMGYPVTSQMEKTMAIQAQRNRARLHVLRDNVKRAKRDVKRRLPGAAERLKAHRATRLAYAENGK